MGVGETGMLIFVHSQWTERPWLFEFARTGFDCCRSDGDTVIGRRLLNLGCESTGSARASRHTEHDEEHNPSHRDRREIAH